ncbi:MAG: M28 family peptidase [Candidatus Bathyarchaeia archaeon]
MFSLTLRKGTAILLSALFLLTFCVAVPSSNANDVSNPVEEFFSFDYIVPSYLIDISGYKTYEQLFYLSEIIGPRRSGTNQSLPAAIYIAEQFKSFGLKVEWHNFTFSVGRTGTCLIVKPEELKGEIGDWSVDGQSPDTAGILANVTYVYYTGDIGAFEAVKDIIIGTIAFIEVPYASWTTTFRRQACTIAASYGAVAALLYSYNPALWGTSETAGGADLSETESLESSLEMQPLPIPLLYMSYRNGYPSPDAEFLKQHWSEVTLFIRTNPAYTATGYNVIGILEGLVEPEKYIIICGHYDTAGKEVPGADDNTSGTATVLELARVLSMFHPYVTIKFIVWDAEERGLLGARAYVRDYADDIANGRILAVLNYDMNGAGYPTFKLSIYTRPKYRPPYPWDTFTDEQKARFNELIAHTESVVYDDLELPKGVGIPGFVGVVNDTLDASDHYPFTSLAVPGWLMIGAEREFPTYHTPGDTVEYLINSMGGLDKLVTSLRVSGLIGGALALEISKVLPDDALRAVGRYFGKAESYLALAGRKAVDEIVSAYKAGEDYNAVADLWISTLREMTRRFVKALELALDIVRQEESHALSRDIKAKTEQLNRKETLIETQIQKLLQSLPKYGQTSMDIASISFVSALPVICLKKKKD